MCVLFLFWEGVILWTSVNMHFSQMLPTQEILQKAENVWEFSARCQSYLRPWNLNSISLFVQEQNRCRPTTHNAEAILPLVRQLAVNEQLEQTVSSLNGLNKGYLYDCFF